MPTTVTHFKFVQIPDTSVVDSFIDGNPLQEGVLYPIADQNKLSFDRKLEFENIPLSSFGIYIVNDSDNNINSNEAIFRITWEVGDGVPGSSDFTELIENSESITMLSKIPINGDTEFIEVTEMNGVPNLKRNGASVYVGQRLTTTDLNQTEFTSESEGGGEPYFHMGYKAGKNNQLESDVYNFDLNISSLGVLSILSGPTVNNYTEDFDDGGNTVTYNVKDEKTEFKISLGHVYASAWIEVIINSPFLSLNQWNSVEINTSGGQAEYFENQTVNLYLNLDKYGSATFSVSNIIVLDTATPANGDITLTLKEIKSDPSLVDGLQEVNLITNL